MSLPAWLIVRWWQDRLYPTPESRDPVHVFVKDMTARVKRDHTVLDVGAGAGHLNTYALKGNCKRIVGVDLDPRVAPIRCWTKACGRCRRPQVSSADF